MLRVWPLVGLSVLITLCGPAWSADEDAALFKKHCGTCHTIDKGGKKRQGPNLWGILERPMGSVAGFPYSKKLKASTDLWTPEVLDQWLEKPKQIFSDTYMIYKQADPEIRGRIIKYLQKASRE